MERLSASWDASGKVYEERLAKGLLPRFGLDSLPSVLQFLDPHNLPAIVAANAVYLLVVFVIVRLVKSNGSMSDSIMKPFMLFYNASCVVLAGAVVFGIVRYKLTVRLGTFACNEPDLGTPSGETLAWFIWLYYAQKYYEYLDTIIFALRGSLRQLSFLHVYHHVSITFVTSAFLRHDVNGDCYAAALANSFIHVLMYSHYFCSAVGIKTPWRKQLTSGQLVQFLTIFIQAWIMWFSGPACGYPDWTKAMMIAYQTSMFALFGQFFASQYGSNKNRMKEGGGMNNDGNKKRA